MTLFKVVRRGSVLLSHMLEYIKKTRYPENTRYCPNPVLMLAHRL